MSLGFVGVCAILLLWARHDILPLPPDGYYHLMVARRIVEDGALPLWDWWEFAPYGRPHLYPPLYHLLLALGAVCCGGELLAGFQVVTALLLPVTLLGVWYLARRLFDARRALFALLLTGWDPMFVLMALMSLPSILAGGIAAAGLARFYARRYVSAGVLLACVLSMHPGIGPSTLAGLVLFALWDKEYRRAGLWVALAAGAAGAVWYLRLWAYRSWHVHPIDQGLYGQFEGWPAWWAKTGWLQFLNVAMVVLALWGMKRANWRESRNRLLLCAVLVYAPLLLSYGGRFYLHAVPFLAVFAAEPLTRLRWPSASRSGVLRLAGLALCPTLVIVGFGTVVRPGPLPMVSGWTVPVFLGAGGARLLEGGGRLGLTPFEEARALAEYVRAKSSPEQIVHAGVDRDFAVMVGFLAGRAIDRGAWEEFSPPGVRSRAYSRRVKTDPTGYYVSKLPSGIPPGVPVERVGRFYVGDGRLRGK